MKPYAERRYFPYQVRSAYYLANFVIDELSESTPEIRCHELARATSLIIVQHLSASVQVVVWDGKYGAIDHSWLDVSARFVDHRDRHCILDVYAVGRTPQVQLIDGSALLPEAKAYKIGPTREDIDRVLVKALFDEMRAIVDAYGHVLHDQLGQIVDRRKVEA